MGELVPNDEVIVLEKVTLIGKFHLRVSKEQYVLAESVDVIELLPLDDMLPFRTYNKPEWKVVKH